MKLFNAVVPSAPQTVNRFVVLPIFYVALPTQLQEDGCRDLCSLAHPPRRLLLANSKRRLVTIRLTYHQLIFGQRRVHHLWVRLYFEWNRLLEAFPFAHSLPVTRPSEAYDETIKYNQKTLAT